MLWFLSLAAARGFAVQAYVDDAEGTLARNAQGRLAMTLVTLRPEVLFDGPALPDTQQLHALHEEAHERCFIANSVNTEVRCMPRP
jgi:organic hydroperoxide reductase OsmC/OhrA